MDALSLTRLLEVSIRSNASRRNRSLTLTVSFVPL
jgi:hypothetical protein